MPSINDVPRRVIHAKDPTVKKELDIGLRLPPGASPFFAVAMWGASKEQKAEQENAVEQEVEVEETSLDGKSSMNALFSLFTHSARTAPTAESTPLDSSAEEVVAQQATPNAAAESFVVSSETELSTEAATVETVHVEATLLSTTLTNAIAKEPAVAPLVANQEVVSIAAAPTVEQLSFDVIPAAPEVDANTAEKTKGVRRISPEVARKIRLVNSALIAYSSLFSEEEAPIPENVAAKQKKMPAPDDAREALAELLGMKQKDDIDGILDMLEAPAQTQVNENSVDSNSTPSV